MSNKQIDLHIDVIKVLHTETPMNGTARAILGDIVVHETDSVMRVVGSLVSSFWRNI